MGCGKQAAYGVILGAAPSSAILHNLMTQKKNTNVKLVSILLQYVFQRLEG